MQSFVRVLVLVTPMISCFAHADTLNAEQLTTKVSSSINKLVPDEGDSRSCIRKYTITYKSLPKGEEGGGKPVISKDEQKALGVRMMAAMAIQDPKKQAAEMKKIEEEMGNKLKDQRNKPAGEIVNQVTAVLEYKAAGVEKKDIVLDMPATANENDINKNKELVLKNFEGRFCDHKTFGEAIVEKAPKAAGEKQRSEPVQ